MCSTSLRLVLEVWRFFNLQPAPTQAFSLCLYFVLPGLKVLLIIAHQDPHVDVRGAGGCANTTELGNGLAHDSQNETENLGLGRTRGWRIELYYV